MALTKILRLSPTLHAARADLKEHPDHINQPDELGDTPLHIAAIKGQLLLVKSLVNAQADINATNLVGSTVLHKAVTGGCKGVVDFLLDNNAKWVPNNSGYTPFYYARDILRDKAVLEKFLQIETTVQSEFTINSSDVPFIVGKEAKGLERIRVEAQTIIEVPSKRDGGDGLTRVLQLTARSMEDIELAKKIIEGRIKDKETRDQSAADTQSQEQQQQQQNEEGGNKKKEKEKERKEVDWGSVQYSKHINIPKKSHKRLIGKEAKTINDLQERTGTTIIVPPVSDPSESITVRGEPREVENAIREINKMFKGPDFSSLPERKMVVPKNRHRVIIGKEGKNLERIKKECNVLVSVPKADSPEENITLCGNLPDIERAKFDIITTLKETSLREEDEDRRAPREGRTTKRGGGGGGGGRGDGQGGRSDQGGERQSGQGRRGGGQGGRSDGQGGERQGVLGRRGGGQVGRSDGQGSRGGRGRGRGIPGERDNNPVISPREGPAEDIDWGEEGAKAPRSGQEGGSTAGSGGASGDQEHGDEPQQINRSGGKGRGGAGPGGRGRRDATTTQPEVAPPAKAKPQPPVRINLKDDSEWPSFS